MAIQPIDLQALFTQLDKVGKNQTALRDGQQIQESIQQAQSMRKLEQNVQAVNQTQDMGEEAATIKEQQKHGTQAQKHDSKDTPEDSDNAGGEDTRPDLIRDPALGRNIDISG